MNVTPEVIGRLRRLATSAAKRKDPQWNGRPDKNGEKNKEELQTNAKQNKEIETNSGGGSSTGTSGRISLVLSKKIEPENDAATPGNQETIKESDIKMDMDFFRQMLKEVIVKRTFEIEKRLMGDVEALKKQVLALETEKKKLEWDAKRLQRTLNEISSKRKGQERPGYSQIDNKVAETSISEKPVSPNQPQKTDKSHQAAAVNSEASDSYKIDGNTATQEPVKSSERKRGSPAVHCNTSEVVTTKQVPVTIVDDAKRSSAQNGRGPFTSSSSQGQPSDTQELHNIHMRGSESVHRHLPEVRIEATRPLQGEMPQSPARPAASPNPQTHGQPSVRSTGQELPAASSPNITGHVQGQLSSQPQWLPSQPQRPNNQVQMAQPTQADDVPSHSYPVVRRGPPNVSLFNPYKRRRVDKRSSSNGLHVVSSNSNYVMHNFKLQKPPSALNNLRKRFKTSVPNCGGNQAAYTTSPSNQPIRGPYLNQSSSNIHPVVYPEQHPIRATDKAPVHTQGLPQGQLVERVFYPSTRPRQVSTEYGPRVMSTHPRHQMDPARANGQPVEANGTMYVVREYQVPQQGAPIQAEHAPPSHRAAPLQHIAPVPPGIPRSQPHPPVQSPGISSTASPSGRHPGDPNAGHDQRGTANLSGTVVRNDHPGVQLRTPPKPSASIVVVQDGIVLSWNMGLDETMAKIDNYELFACQDGAESTTPPIMWKKIGIVKALPLPMACTLSQFPSGNKYHFAVRAVDDQERAGPFSDPCTISLTS